MKKNIWVMASTRLLFAFSGLILVNGCSPDDTPVDNAITAKQKLPGTTASDSVAIANRYNILACSGAVETLVPNTCSLKQSPTDDCENPVSCETFIGNIAYCAADGKRLTFCDSNIPLQTLETGWFSIDCSRAKSLNELVCGDELNQANCPTAHTGGCTWNPTATIKCQGAIKLNGVCTVNTTVDPPTADCT